MRADEANTKNEPDRPFTSITEEAIHEKAKKLGGHRTVYVASLFCSDQINVSFSLGESKQLSYRSCTIYPLDQHDPGPYVTFKFFYRPMSKKTTSELNPASSNAS